MENQYDAIIIGSGIAGLTSAALLAKMKKKRVLVLERHFVLGGQTHEFKRKGKYTWDVGLHFVGKMQKNWYFHHIFKYITNGKLKWNKLPEDYSHINFPDSSFKIPSSKKQFKKKLITEFPNEKKAIHQYFKDINRGKLWIYRMFASFFLPGLIAFCLKIINKWTKKYVLKSATEYMNQNFKSEKLKSILQSYWLSYLLPPKECSFATHAVITDHFLSGAYYPEGGASQIAQNIIPVIQKSGGQTLVKAEVTEIIVKNHKAVGVKVSTRQNGKNKNVHYYAPLIISAAGIPETLTKLVHHELPKQTVKEVEQFPSGYSSLQIYLGLKESPEKLGFKGENIFIFNQHDQNKIFSESHEIMKGKPTHCYLSFPTLKSPTKGAHTAEILYYFDYQHFFKWIDQKWLNRDNDYYELKKFAAEQLIDLVNSKYPGFKDLIEYQEVSSPLTMEHFTNRNNGAYNGIPGIVDKFNQKWIGIKTPIQQLYHTGSDVNIVGILGAMMGGVGTVSHILGPLGFLNIIFASYFKS
ncbi:MAG: NAD(P)/FAD-dependent oxidoreductase [Spirochaetes bacterium]|nr:NAD(P)/FAD-dependent oxidoreductase [Spirochaetota bacterium]